jgi:hypothetical protein
MCHQRLSLRRVSSLLALAAALAGCRASPPMLGTDGPIGAPDGSAGAGWADVVVAYTEGAVTHSCTGDLGACGAIPSGCAAAPVLGPTDGQAFSLAAGETLLVGFRCALIRAHGAGLPDFTIWAALPPEAPAVVEVSADGSRFQSVEPFGQPNQSFSLASVQAQEVRFVRITAGSSSVPVDAVQAL